MTAPSGSPVVVDPFDLPEVLGEGEVVWRSLDGLHHGHLVHGVLALTGDQVAHDATEQLACDLMAVDEAYPAPVAPERLRLLTHQAWRHGQIHLVSYGDRLTLLVPGTGFTADLVLDAVGRLAKALGAAPEAYSVHLRLGG